MRCSQSEDGRAAGGLCCRALLPFVFILLFTLPARADPLTNVQTVFLIVMENHNWADIFGNTNCPYLNETLLPMASRAKGIASGRTSCRSPSCVSPRRPAVGLVVF